MEALRASQYRDFTVVVVDHGTTDETRIGLASEFPEVIRIAGPSDAWWTGATNVGIRFALDQGADMLMLLNNDSYVTPETIGVLIRLGQQNTTAIIAPIQRDWQSGKITTISIRSFFLLGFPTTAGPRKLTAAMSTKELLAVKLIRGGRGVIIPVKVFTRMGLFDEAHLPHYYADHDFYLRASRHNIPLYVSTRTFIDIDDTRTTLADNPGSLNFSEFLHSLRSIRSHRNLKFITALFRKHYPIPYLHLFGVALYTGRYVLVYLIKRMVFLLRGYLTNACSRWRN